MLRQRVCEQPATAVVDALRAELSGEVDDSNLTRGIYSTDASNYRVVPEIVVMPRNNEDVIRTVKIAKAHGIPITGRGAGTSCAGNSIGPGIVIDFSRHMNQVLDIDIENRSARIQPGVVLNDLQERLAPYGLRFGPDPSTANRCTLGGMMGNNACGPHGLSYGRTADNIRSLTWLTGTGEVLELGKGKESIAVIPGLENLILHNLALLRTEFGRFGRQISGYSLEHLLPEQGRNLAAALIGTEGTCGLLLEAEVALVPRSAKPALAVLGYPDMACAADDVPNLLSHRPLALEGLDAQLVDVIRRRKGPDSTPDLPQGGGWLMIEMDGEDSDDAVARAHALIADSHCLDSVVHPAGPEATQLWQIRADGAGLAGRTADGRQAWPGWEDSAVPPAHLGEYLRKLSALMDEYQLSGLAYGHFGDGCIHLRIDFPLDTTGEVLRNFMTDAANLAASFGGSLSGEHGDGRARSELLSTMYSKEALSLMSQFKGLFDPDNLMNPGVIVDPSPLDADLRRPHAKTVIATDGFAFSHDDGNITNAVHRCVGVGKCRADSRGVGGFMCPSYVATKNEKDSTRGRARALQEMLAGGVVSNGWQSKELLNALDLCLSCKACGNDCPTGIDMALFKSETLHRAYRHKIRPLSHYTLGRLPQWLRLAGPFAPLINVAGRITALRKFMLACIGADTRRSLPILPRRSFSSTHKQTHSSQTEHRTHDVVLWVDSFTDTLSPGIAYDAITVLESADCNIEIATGICCGLTLISTGQLIAARKKLRKLVDHLYPKAAAGKVIIGIEPSCTATLRSDLTELLPGDPQAAKVAAQVRTVAEFLTEIGYQPPHAEHKLLAQPHCHHYSIIGYNADKKILKDMGCDVEYVSGCCGLAGNFGMEQGHYEVSVAVGENGILGKLDAQPDREILADGFSCRTQVRDLRDRDSQHLVQLLAQAIRNADQHARPNSPADSNA